MLHTLVSLFTLSAMLCLVTRIALKLLGVL